LSAPSLNPTGSECNNNHRKNDRGLRNVTSRRNSDRDERGKYRDEQSELHHGGPWLAVGIHTFFLVLLPGHFL
jgi:hypothetical protein